MITPMSRYWRRRLAEDLDMEPTAHWYDVESALFATKTAAADAVADAARARRDLGEMQAFMAQAARWWYEAGAAGQPGPDEVGA